MFSNGLSWITNMLQFKSSTVNRLEPSESEKKPTYLSKDIQTLRPPDNNDNNNNNKYYLDKIGLPFQYMDKDYYLIGMDGLEQLNNIPKITKSSLGIIYGKCFTWGNNDTIINLNSFTEGQGTTIIITNKKGMTQFIVSIIKNKDTKHIEFFNICKDLEQQELKGYDILSLLINYFIPENPIFSNYHKLRLALNCNNPYIIAAFKTYCRLGFSVEDQRMPVKSMLSNYITMSRDLRECSPTDFNQQLEKLIKVGNYNSIERERLLNSIIK